MSGDTRLWMYRKGEARLFEHRDHVPRDEDWQRFPVAGAERGEISKAPAEAPQDNELSQEEKLDSMSRQHLMKIAADCGIRFGIAWTKARLKQAIIEVLHDNRA
ncbi:MAG: hypothetical protein WAN43_14170 [Rhodomicrobium sp.]|jgi:hypothetical protein